MKPLDTSFIDDAGLSNLTDEQKDTILAFVIKTLETRVGIRLAELATKEQLEEFETLTDEQRASWFESSFPNFHTVVDEELAELKTELADMAPDILAA